MTCRRRKCFALSPAVAPLLGEPVAGLRFEPLPFGGGDGGDTIPGGSPWPGEERTLSAPSWPVETPDEGTNGRGAELRLGASRASSLPDARLSRIVRAERRLWDRRSAMVGGADAGLVRTELRLRFWSKRENVDGAGEDGTCSDAASDFEGDRRSISFDLEAAGRGLRSVASGLEITEWTCPRGRDKRGDASEAELMRRRKAPPERALLTVAWDRSSRSGWHVKESRVIVCAEKRQRDVTKSAGLLRARCNLV